LLEYPLSDNAVTLNAAIYHQLVYAQDGNAG
jgi:hypothetical protein